MSQSLQLQHQRRQAIDISDFVLLMFVQAHGHKFRDKFDFINKTNTPLADFSLHVLFMQLKSILWTVLLCIKLMNMDMGFLFYLHNILFFILIISILNLVIVFA